MKIEHSAEFDCPPERLWVWLEEPERQKQWMKGLLENEKTSEGPSRVGSTFRMRIQEGRRVADYEGEVTHHDAPRDLGVKFRGGCGGRDMEMRARYRLTDLGDGRTRLDYTAEGELPGLFKLLAPLARLFGKLQLKGFLKTLQKLVAQETVAA